MKLPQNLVAKQFRNIEWAGNLISGRATGHIFGPETNSTDFVLNEGYVLRSGVIFFELSNYGLLPLQVACSPLRPHGVIRQANPCRLENCENE